MASKWTTHTLKNGDQILWDHGHVRLKLQRIKDDWVISSDVSEEPAGEAEINPEAEGDRWAFSGSCDTVRFSPCLPDRSLVVRPSQPLSIPPASKIQFFIDIPVWIRLEIGDKRQMVEVLRLGGQKLSNTWFGDNTAGVFCYANKSFLRRELDDTTQDPNHVICPFKIHNTSKEALSVDRICVHVKYLSIYETDHGLWSNDVSVTFHGSGKETSVDHSRTQPKLANKAKVVFESEEKPSRDYSLQTFLHQGIFRRKEKEK